MTNNRPNPLRLDPTRTTMLRKRFVAEINRRMDALLRKVTKLIVDEDAFGLAESRPLMPLDIVNVFCPTGLGGGVDPTCSPGKSGGYAARVTRKMAKIEPRLAKIERELRTTVDAMSERYHELGGDYATASKDKEYNRLREKSNTLSRRADPLREEMRRLKEDQKILTLPKAAHSPNVKVAPGVDVHPEVAQRLVESLLVKPWGDESQHAAARYDYTLEKVRGSGEKIYQFKIESKTPPSERPPNALDEVPNRPNKVYRGMSREEWDQAKQRGYIESEGSHNLGAGQVGRTYYGSAEVAHHYSAGFAPMAYKATPDKPGVVIEIPRSKVQSHEDDPTNIPQSEFAHLGRLPIDQVSTRYDVVAVDFKPGMVEVVHGYHGVREGSRSSPSASTVVVERDPTINVFRDYSQNELIANTRWKFLTRERQLEQFKLWLFNQIAADVIPQEMPTGDFWLRQFIYAAYTKGMGRAFDAVKHPELREDLDFYAGTREEFLRSAFSRPVSAERVKLMASRTFDDLQNITQQMSNQIGQRLTDGMIRGSSPREVAREIAKSVDVGKKRALVIARTETVRAHNEGQLDSLESLGVASVGVSVEWRVSGGTAKGGASHTGKGYDSPCPLCAPLNGAVFSLKEAHGMLPRHPNCMCSWIPAGVGEDKAKQARSKSRIQDAIRRSISAERPKRKKRTIDEQRKRSRWAGADRTIAKKRPEPIL